MMGGIKKWIYSLGLCGLCIQAFSGAEPTNVSNPLLYEELSFGKASEQTVSTGTQAVSSLSAEANTKDFETPIIKLNGSSLVTLSLGEPYVEPGFRVTDSSYADLSELIVCSGLEHLDINKPGFYPLTYTFSHDFVSSVRPVVRIIHVEPPISKRNQAFRPSQASEGSGSPVLVLLGEASIIHQVGTVYNDEGASASDTGANPDEFVVVTPIGLSNVDVDALGTYTIIYTALDSDGNPAIPVARTVTVVDTQAPVIQLSSATASLTHPVGDIYLDQLPLATDNHDASVAVQRLGLNHVNVNLVGTYTLTYTASDSSGNQAVPKTRTIRVVDEVDPVITLNGSAAINQELGLEFVDPGYVVTDNYDASLDVVVSGDVNTTLDGVYTITYQTSDSSGNQAVVTRTVSVKDTLAPVITLVGDASLLHQVNTDYLDGGVSAFDGVDGSVAIVTTGQVNTGVLGNYTLTFSATDSVGNRAIATRTVRVADTLSPAITLNGETLVSHQLGQAYNDKGALLTDNYDPDVSLAGVGTVDVNTAGVYTLTYVGEDSSKNQASPVTRSIEVADFVAPVITLNGGSFITHQLGAAYVDGGSVVSDNIDNNLQASVEGEVITTQLGTYVLSFSAVDSSGNAAEIVSRTVTVVDAAPPMITLTGGTIITIPVGTPFQEPGVSAVDAEDGAVEVTTLGLTELDTGTAGIYTLTYLAFDTQGNEADPVVRTIIVEVIDDEAPVIALNTPLVVMVDLGDVYTDPGYSVQDNLDDSVQVVVSGAVNTNALGTYTLTYTARDEAGNEAIPQTRVVNVVSTDDDPPLISLIGNDYLEHPLGEAYQDSGATALDGLDGEVEVTILGLENLDVDEAGIYTLTYTASDVAGNRAEPVTRTVNVTDLTSPVLVLNGSNRVEHALGATYVDAGVTATDNVDANVAVAITGSVQSNVPGTYTLTYTASDAAGNQAVPLTRIIVVKGSDVTPPTISLNGTSSIEISLGDPYIELGATASDDTDQNVAVNIVGEVNVDQLGVYTLTYTASDSSGNQAIPVARTVLIVDKGLPVLTLLGPAEVTHEAGDIYQDAGAQALDDVEGNLPVLSAGFVDDAQPGVYVITYMARDSSGNQALPINRTVSVVDTTSPIIQLVGGSSMTLVRGQTFTDPGFVVVDAEAGLQVDVTGAVDSTTVGSYSLTYAVSDSAGNVAESVTRTVLVKDPADSSAPVITLNGNAVVNVEAGDTYNDAGATALDAVDGSLAVSYSGEVNTSKPGSYTITYYATDLSGNQADSVSRIIKVVDTKAPVITLMGSASITHQLGDLYNDAGATATDIADPSVAVITTGRVDVTAVGTYILTYSAVDNAGNQAVAITREVRVESFSENLGLISFETSADGATLTLSKCDVTASGGIEIPSQFAGLTVNAIGKGAFEGCVGLETILIPDTVLSIGDGAFAGCSLIQEIIVPSSITSVGDGIFAGCSALASITFGGDAPSLPASGFLADEASAAVVYVDAYADGFEATYGGLVVSRPDVIAPVLMLEGHPEISHEALTPYLDAGAIATDETDAEVVVKVDGEVDVTTLGTYELTYSAADQAGNQATKVTRLVHVVDTMAPVIQLAGEQYIAHPVFNPFQDPGAIATDTVDGALSVVVTGAVNPNTVGIYEIHYTATDASGNSTQATRFVTVGDGLAVHSLIATQPIINENGGTTQIKVRLTQPAADRALLYVEASPNNRIRLSSSILSLPAGSRELNFAVIAVDNDFPNGDQPVKLTIKSLYRELGSLEITIRDNEVTHFGLVSDGLVSGATVFFDMNGNGVHDGFETSTVTDKLGTYQLDLPINQYDQNGDGLVDAKDGSIVAFGGLDTATGLPLEHPLSAPPSASVVNPLTTLVSALLASDGSLNESQASAKVGEALGLDSAVDLLSYDMINAASNGSSTAVEVIQAAAAVQDTVVQVASAIGVSAGTGTEVVTTALIDRINQGQALELNNPAAVSELLDASAQKAQKTVSPAVRDAASAIIASANQLKVSAAAGSSTSAEAALAIAKVQVVAQSVLSEDLVAMAAGTSSVSSVAAKYEVTSIQQLADESVVGPLSGIDMRAGSFEFSRSNYAFDESGKGDHSLKILRKDGNLGQVTLEVAVLAGTAEVGEEFKATAIQVVFDDQEISQTLAMSDLLIDDSIAESAKTFTLALRLPKGTPAAIKLGKQTTASVEVFDNDSPGRFQFDVANPLIWEDAGKIALRVERLDGTQGIVALNVAVRSIGQALEGQDFALLTRQLSFDDGGTQRLVMLEIIDDQLMEKDESFNLVLSLAKPDVSGATLGDLSEITLTLISNDDNLAPTLSSVPDQRTRKNEILEVGGIILSDDYTLPENLIVSAVSDNPQLIPDANIQLVRSVEPGQYTLKVQPLANKSGVARISLSVSDGELSSQISFQLKVLEANQAPTITAIPEQINASGRVLIVPFTIDDSDDEASKLLLYIQTEDSRYLAQGHILIQGQGSDRQLIINQTGLAQGASRFKLFVVDSEGLDASRDFEVDFGGEQSAPVLNLQLAGDATIELSWDGDYRLFYSQAIDQPFQEVVGASSPYAVTMSDQGFYKLMP